MYKMFARVWRCCQASLMCWQSAVEQRGLFRAEKTKISSKSTPHRLVTFFTRCPSSQWLCKMKLLQHLTFFPAWILGGPRGKDNCMTEQKCNAICLSVYQSCPLRLCGWACELISKWHIAEGQVHLNSFFSVCSSLNPTVSELKC